MTLGAPGASGFMWAAFFFTGKYSRLKGAVDRELGGIYREMKGLPVQLKGSEGGPCAVHFLK